MKVDSASTEGATMVLVLNKDCLLKLFKYLSLVELSIRVFNDKEFLFRL